VYWASLRAVGAGHSLYGSVFDSQPPLFLLALHPLEAALGSGIEASRAGVLALSLVGVAAGFVAARALAGPAAGLAAAVVLAADPLAAAAGVTLQAEAPAMAVGLVAVALAADSRRRGGWWAVVEAGLAGEVAALAVLTKLLAAPVLVPVAILLAVPLAPGSPAPWRRVGAGAVGFVVGSAAVLLPFAPDLHALADQVFGFHLAARTAVGDDIGAALVREIPLVLIAAATLAAAWRRLSMLCATGVGWLAATALALTAQRPLFEHHLVSLVPPLALIAAPTLAGAGAWVHRRLGRAGVVALAVAAAAAVVVGAQPARVTAGDDPLVAQLRAATRPGALLVTDDQFAVIAAGRDIVPELVDTSFVRIAAGSLDAERIERLAVQDNVDGFMLATGRLGSLPGLPAWVTAHYPAVHHLARGATLYLRQ